MQDIARAWYLRPQDLPADVHRGGLEATVGYKPERDSGTFSYAAHAVTVAVDPEIGDVEILDYVVVEDGGKLVNPMVVDGQIYGGLAQGIGTALYEEMPFDENGQPLAVDLRRLSAARADRSPRAATRSYGDAGALHAVRRQGPRRGWRDRAARRDRQRRQRRAERALSAELLCSPITPRRVLEAIAAGKRRKRSALVKPVDFDYARPRRLDDAIALLAESGERGKVLAGGQSLGPMLNMRLVQPELIVDITALDELKQAGKAGDHLVLGACVTHADIEDGRVGDVTNGAMRAVAARHRLSRGAQSRHHRRQPDQCRSRRPTGCRRCRRSAPKSSLRGAGGARTMAAEDFVTGALETALPSDELAGGDPRARAFRRRAMGLLQGLPQDRRICPRDRRGAARPLRATCSAR